MNLKIAIFSLFLLVIGVPAMAQDDVERLEIPGVEEEQDDQSVSIIPEDEDFGETLQVTETEDIPAEEDDLSTPQSTIGNPVFDRLPPELQQEILEEAETVHQKCSERYTFSRFHDCDCVAAKFVDARIEQGPGLGAVYVAQNVAVQCPNKPGIAGFAWDQCQNVAEHMPYGRDEFCTCFARQYVDEYMERPILKTPWLNTVMTRSLGKCDKGNGPIKGEWR